jgi:nitrous-oxide reductase
MKRLRLPLTMLAILGGFVGLTVLMTSCGGQASLVTGDAASKIYVSPGEHDELYGFFSGGYSGQVAVYGLPSARLHRVIPVFSQDPESGYGYSEETKALLMTSYGFIPWDDSHHPHLSQTDGDSDGRWLFINGNNTPRIARIDLQTFETVEIIEIPNTAGNHGSPFATENTEYIIASTRFSVPFPNEDVAINTYREKFKGALTFLTVDQETGRMDVDFQLVLPGFNYDLARAGKRISGDWAFFTSYNTEQAYTMLESGASQNDKDMVVAVNWRKASEAVRAGQAREVPAEYYHNFVQGNTQTAVSEIRRSVNLLDPKEVPGLVYFIPTPKSPHGVDVDPSGEYLVAGGKLATVIPVHSFTNMITAIENEDYEGFIEGIPVLRYDSVLKGEVQNPGLGPLHTEFDGKGYAYTSVYISSEIVKWRLSDFQIVDRIPTYYSIGHLMIPGGDNVNPFGRYVVALNKTTKDRHLPTGPKQNHAAQLYDISGDRMELLVDFLTIGEPHYAQAIAASKIKDRMKTIYDLSQNEHPHATKRPSDVRIEREGNVVRVYMSSIRSHFNPDNIEGIRVGDTVYFHVTNVEQDWDMVHGLAIKGSNNAEILIVPGQTKTLQWVPQRPGIYPFYCTAFCSALHQEMSGYVRVSPSGSNVPLAYHTGYRQ